MSIGTDSAYTEIKLVLGRPHAQLLVQHLDASAIPGLEGYFETLYQENQTGENTTLHFYFDPEDSVASLKVELLAAAAGAEDYELESATVSRQEYLENYKKHYSSFRIGDFAIIPSWKKDQAGSYRNTKILFLDPGLAFGTGLHPTTQMCLVWISEHLSRIEGRRVVDAGTGSGILALAALIAGAGSVLAFDVESNAIRAARQNLELNPTLPANRLQLELGGFDLEAVSLFGGEILLGNLTASIILGAKEQIQNARFPRMILTGILDEQQSEVRDAFHEWSLVHKVSLDGWCLMELELSE